MRGAGIHWALPLCALLCVPAAAKAETITIVAAENVYGDIAKQIGGENVAVTSILSNPNQDPHLFEVSPSVAGDVAAARLIISNGIGYDAWMQSAGHADPGCGRGDTKAKAEDEVTEGGKAFGN